MSNRESRTQMAQAFRETLLSLIGLFQIYKVDPDLTKAVSDTLGRQYRQHLAKADRLESSEKRKALHALVDEMDEVIGDAG
ncbi:MAG: hypothetical protein MUC50_05280 [Myxococcota bacterium]|jgi:hypothetical protein|nr:hypothetical protein [Myxococcota bacterium]